MDYLIPILFFVCWGAIGTFLYRRTKRSAGTRLSAGFMGVAGGFLGVFMLLAGIAVVVDVWTWMIAPPAPPTAEEQCRDDWHRCTDNAMLVNSWGGELSASRACQQAADDQAKFGHPTFSSVPFGSYRRGADYVPAGQLVLIDKGTAFQNGFGAWERVTAICAYDLKAGKVTELDAVPRDE